MTKVWVVEDEELKRATLVGFLTQRGYQAKGFTDAEGALAEIGREPPQIVITDLKLPGRNGLELISELKTRMPGLPVVMMTAYETVETAVEAMRLGAYDYLVKPVELKDILSVIQRIEQLEQSFNQKGTGEESGLKPLVGKSIAMQGVYDLVKRVAPTSATVLIQGESGTGKELLAEALHSLSHRRDRPLIKVSCSILTETLLESELFGHEKGAFTGAIRTKPGRFELAEGGTIFLDDVDDIPMTIQVKLLRVLQEKKFERVGGTETITVDVRVIAATKSDLMIRVKQGTFREDLYFRINVVLIQVPPLRDRIEDIPLLVDHFLDKFCCREGKPRPNISREILDSFLSYPWPGNVRELENAVERMVALITPGTEGDFSFSGPGVSSGWTPSFSLYERVKKDKLSFDQAVEEVEQELICLSLKEAKGNKARAARILKMKRSTYCDKVRKYRLGAHLSQFR